MATRRVQECMVLLLLSLSSVALARRNPAPTPTNAPTVRALPQLITMKIKFGSGTADDWTSTYAQLAEEAYGYELGLWYSSNKIWCQNCGAYSVTTTSRRGGHSLGFRWLTEHV